MKEKLIYPTFLVLLTGHGKWEISKPFWSGSAVDHYSRKQKYTIVNQGVCDGNLMFLAVNSGFPGSIHDSRMFDHTWLAEALKNNEIQS